MPNISQTSKKRQNIFQNSILKNVKYAQISPKKCEICKNIPHQDGYNFVGNCFLYFVKHNDEKNDARNTGQFFSMRQQALTIPANSYGGGPKFF